MKTASAPVAQTCSNRSPYLAQKINEKLLRHSWNSKKDRHAGIGNGMIPFHLLEKTARFAHSKNIDMIFEC